MKKVSKLLLSLFLISNISVSAELLYCMPEFEKDYFPLIAKIESSQQVIAYFDEYKSLYDQTLTDEEKVKLAKKYEPYILANKAYANTLINEIESFLSKNIFFRGCYITVYDQDDLLSKQRVEVTEDFMTELEVKHLRKYQSIYSHYNQLIYNNYLQQ